MRIFLAVVILYQVVIVALFTNAFLKQPARTKARRGIVASVVFLVLEFTIYFWFSRDAETGILFAFLAAAFPLVLTLAAYRTYSRWDRKHWDTNAPDFVGWIQ